MTKSLKSFCISFCLVIITITTALSSTAANAEGIAWQTWSGSVFTKAKQTQHPVLLYVKAEWCHWCSKMSSSTMQDDAVIKVINTNFIPVRIDLDSNMDIAKKYGVSQLPTFIIMNSDQQVITQFSGYNTADDLIAKLRAAAN